MRVVTRFTHGQTIETTVVSHVGHLGRTRFVDSRSRKWRLTLDDCGRFESGLQDMVVMLLHVITAKMNQPAFRILSQIAAGVLTIFRFTSPVVLVATRVMIAWFHRSNSFNVPAYCRGIIPTGRLRVKPHQFQVHKTQGVSAVLTRAKVATQSDSAMR